MFNLIRNVRAFIPLIFFHSGLWGNSKEPEKILRDLKLIFEAPQNKYDKLRWSKINLENPDLYYKVVYDILFLK